VIEAICELLAITAPDSCFSIGHYHSHFWNNRLNIYHHSSSNQKVRICYVSLIDNAIVIHNSPEAQYPWKSIELADPYLPEKVWCTITEYIPKGAHGNP